MFKSTNATAARQRQQQQQQQQQHKRPRNLKAQNYGFSQSRSFAADYQMFWSVFERSKHVLQVSTCTQLLNMKNMMTNVVSMEIEGELGTKLVVFVNFEQGINLVLT